MPLPTGSSRSTGFTRYLLRVPAALLLTAAAAAAQSPGTDLGHIKAEQFYSNMQVFNGAPADQVMPAMYFFASSLGVECEFCHEGDRAKDLPQKVMARRMVQLTQSINNGSFGGARRVTCFTCHKGSPHPESAPQAADGFRVPTAAHGPAPSRQLGTLPTPDQLFTHFVEAAGGGAALASIRNITTAGTVTDAMKVAQPYTLVIKGPSSRVARRQQGTREVPEALTGDMGWLIDRGNHLRYMRFDELDAARLVDSLWFPTTLKNAISEPRTEGLEQVPGEAAMFVVAGRTPALPLVRLFFDQTTGMLTRISYTTEAGIGRFPTEVAVNEFRTVDGASIPARWTVTEILNRVWSYKMDSLRRDVPIDDAAFVKPAEHGQH